MGRVVREGVEMITEYPAVFIVHWPGKDIPACVKHAEQLVGLGRVLGCAVSVTPVIHPPLDEDIISCVNCENEAKTKTP